MTGDWGKFPLQHHVSLDLLNREACPTIVLAACFKPSHIMSGYIDPVNVGWAGAKTLLFSLSIPTEPAHLTRF
ncbi:MAG: hypothetical protein AB4426_02195 [Xenococcaceae cyanobacterium]